MFRENYKADFEKITPNPDSIELLSKKMRAESENRNKNYRFAIARYAALAALVAVVAVFPYLGMTSHFGESNLLSPSAGVSTDKNSSSKQNASSAADPKLYAGLFKQIDTKKSNQPEAVKGVAMGTNVTESAPAPNVDDPNLLAAGIDTADIVKTDGDYVFAIVRNEDGTIDVDIVSAEGSKSTVSARILCGDELTKYSDFAAAEGVNSQEIIKHTMIPLGAKSYKYYARAMYAQDSRLTVIVGYPNCTVTLIYDISNPASPALLNSFGQSGSYNTSQISDGTLYTTTNYSVNNANQVNLTSYVPQTVTGGAASYIPMSDIYTGTGNSNQYMVVSSVKMSDMPNLLYTKAYLGSYEDIYISSDSLLLASTVEETLKNYTTYGDWHQVPDNLKTSSTGNRVRYSWNTTITTENLKLTLFSQGDDNMTPIATCILSGSLGADQTRVDENNGYFRIVTSSFKNVSSYGSFVNENGDHIDYCSSDGVSAQPAVPNLDTDNALYVLDSKLNKVGSISKLTSEWIDSVKFNNNTCTIKTNDQTISVDLSIPAEPKAIN